MSLVGTFKIVAELLLGHLFILLLVVCIGPVQVSVQQDGCVGQQVHCVRVVEGAIHCALIVHPKGLHKHLHESINLLRFSWQSEPASSQIKP